MILKTNQEFCILTEKISYGRKKSCKRGFFGGDNRPSYRLATESKRSSIAKNKVAKVVHDKLIVHEKERGSDISETQGDP